MSLRKNERSPIHNSFFCCRWEQLWGSVNSPRRCRGLKIRVTLVGTLEIRSPTDMRILLKQKVQEQNVCSAICARQNGARQ
jgi:hypothetical protein